MSHGRKAFGLAPRIAERIGRSVYHGWEDLVLRHDLGSYRDRQVQAEMHMRPAGEDMGALAKLGIGYRGPAYLDLGYMGWIGYTDRKPFGFIWWSDRGAELPHPALNRYGVDLNATQACLFDFFVAPAFRGTLAAAFLSSACTRLEADGFREVFGWVESDNVAARWLYSAQGWEEVRRVRSHLILSSFLLAERRVFISNRMITLGGRVSGMPSVDYTQLIPLR